MKLDFSNSKRNYILLYPAGTGGELITGGLSNCVPEMNSIEFKETELNRWFTSCKITYKDYNGIPVNYLGENKRHKWDLYKDHYGDKIYNYWDPNMTALCFDLTKNYQYWSRLCYYKLRQIEAEVKRQGGDFINNHQAAIQDDHRSINIATNYFKNSHIINIDNLHNSPTELTEQFKDIFPNLESKKFNKIIKKWIKKNNKLLITGERNV
jgi:hypothetical protein